MRAAILFVLAFTCSADVGAQELLWQGTLVGGEVQITVNRLDAEHNVGIPAAGLPITVTRWDRAAAYRSRMYLLSATGELVLLDAAEASFFEAVPDLENSRFFVKGETWSDYSEQVVPLDGAWPNGVWWQIGFDQFVVNGQHESFLFEPGTGTRTLLAADINCERIAIADNGTIALHGTRADQQEVLRVTNAGGKVLFERSSSRCLEDVCGAVASIRPSGRTTCMSGSSASTRRRTGSCTRTFPRRGPASGCCRAGTSC